VQPHEFFDHTGTCIPTFGIFPPFDNETQRPIVNDVTSRLPKLLIALALAGSIGLHWAVFQSVAWLGMVISYSQQAPLTEALSQTFDGKHPCSLCNRIAEAKKGQHKSERQFEIKKLEGVDLRRANPILPTASFICHTTGNTTAPLLSEAPPVPPPRVA
jgi:hypothetical protein